jgi:hypothetical protein
LRFAAGATRRLAVPLFRPGSVRYLKEHRDVDAKDYRAKARELREIAKTMKEVTACAHLLELADGYDLLAKHAEDDDRESKKP